MSFLDELKRRRVFRVAAAYAVVAFGLIQAADLIFPRLGLPDWSVTLVIVLAILGLPAALVLAWAFDATPEGIRVEGQPRVLWRISANRRRAIALSFVLLLVVAAGFALARGRDEGDLSSDVVAILPFAVRAGPDLAYLGEGMVSLLSTKLDGAGALRTVDPRALLSRVAGTPVSQDDPRGASSTARSFGAARMVLGDVVQGGDRVRVTAAVYDVARDPARKIVEGSAEGRGTDVFMLVDSVAAQLLAGMDGEPARVLRVAAVTTSSIDAFKDYIDGDRAFRAGHFVDAIDALQSAVRHDSTFALAWYRVSLAYEYRGLGHEATDAAARAVAHSDRLSERDRRMLAAFMAWRAGDSDLAERLYRAHTATYPDEVEAWFELGEVLFHLNPLRGRSFTEAEQPFRRVLEFEPGHVAASIHLARIAYGKHDLTAMDSFVAAIERAQADRALENLALRAFAHRDTAAIRVVLDQLDQASDDDIAFAVWVVGTYGSDLDGAEAITDVMTRAHGSRERRAYGHAVRAYLHAGRGRWRDARADLAEARRLEPTMGLELAGGLLLMPHAPVTRAELIALREDLEAMTPAMLDAATTNRHASYSGHDEMHRLIRLYLIGLIHADLQEFAAADSIARTLSTFEAPPPNDAFRDGYAVSVRARSLLGRDRPADALALLQGSDLRMSSTLHTSPFHNQGIIRAMLAETLMALGRHEEALPRYANFVGSSSTDLAMLPLAHLRQGEIHERAGRTEDAARHYARFLELFPDPDPEVAHLRDDALRSLERVRSR